MKTFLRDVATRQYFRSADHWTFDREEAHDFGFIPQAMRIARKLGVSTLEVVVSFEDSLPLTNMSLADFLRGLSRPGRRRTAGSRA